MINKTFWKCVQCCSLWTTQKSKVLPHLSKSFTDKSTLEKPFKTQCRKCFLKEEYKRVTKEV